MVSTEGAIGGETEQLGSLGDSQLATPIEFQSVLIGLGASVTFSLLTELIGWFMTYRHDDYKKQVEEVVALQERVEQMQEKMEYEKGYKSSNQTKA